MRKFTIGARNSTLRAADSTAFLPKAMNLSCLGRSSDFPHSAPSPSQTKSGKFAETVTVRRQWQGYSSGDCPRFSLDSLLKQQTFDWCRYPSLAKIDNALKIENGIRRMSRDVFVNEMQSNLVLIVCEWSCWRFWKLFFWKMNGRFHNFNLS